MSYCPKCKYYFENDVKVCPDCKTELVDQIPQEEVDVTKWMSLERFSSSVMADMLKEALEENEIVCLEKSDMFHSAFSMEATSIAGGEFEIFVPNDKLEKAKNILLQLNSRIAN